MCVGLPEQIPDMRNREYIMVSRLVYYSLCSDQEKMRKLFQVWLRVQLPLVACSLPYTDPPMIYINRHTVVIVDLCELISSERLIQNFLKKR